MITIGLRAAPSVVTFAIYDSAEKAIVNIEDLKVPAALRKPEALKYVRSNLLDILREYRVQKAGIRATEPAAQSPSLERIQIEGVIQEAFASSELVAYYVGHIASIAARCKFPRTDFKLFVKEGKQYGGIENWDALTEPQREAVLTAIGAVDA